MFYRPSKKSKFIHDLASQGGADRKTISDKTSQVKHNENKRGKKDIIVKQSCWNIMEKKTVATTHNTTIDAEKTTIVTSKDKIVYEY